MKYHPMYKSEIAAAAGVSRRTLSRWMAEEKEALAEMGVRSTRHLLPARAVRYLDARYSLF